MFQRNMPVEVWWIVSSVVLLTGFLYVSSPKCIKINDVATKCFKSLFGDS